MVESAKTVSFTRMKDATGDDYLLLRDLEHECIAGTGGRAPKDLARQAEATSTGWGHALQSATRAENDGADIDWIVAALLYGIGDGLAPADHDKFAAEIIRPHAREECAWVVENHGAFQKVYYMHHYGGAPNERDNFKNHPCFQACVDFCERRDRSSFDPYYPTRPLEHFAPMAHGVFPRRCGKVWRPASAACLNLSA